MGAQKRKPYMYIECGLDNVFVYGVEPVVDDHGKKVFGVENINGLHRAIAHRIVTQNAAMTGKQLRFLRTEMGLTQAELAKLVHKEPLTVGRWEREENPIDENADTLIRLIGIERMGLDPKMSVKELSGLSVPRAAARPIDIDGSDPKNYRPVAA